MLRRVFLLIKRIDFMIQIHESFQSLTRTTIPILVSKRGSPTFSDWGHSLNINLKNYARTNFVLFDQFTWQKKCAQLNIYCTNERSLLQYSFLSLNNVRVVYVSAPVAKVEQTVVTTEASFHGEVIKRASRIPKRKPPYNNKKR